MVRPAVPAPMRTSVPGRSDRGFAGFTLIELLVTIVVIAVASTLVGLSLAPAQRQGLRADAERLALLLAAAREEALVRGRPVRLSADATGYRFLFLGDRQWRSLEGAPFGRGRTWDAPTVLTLSRADGRPELEFGREPVDSPFLLTLEREGSRIALAGDGLGRFEVLR
jgi:general secretion pathway protein H